MTAPLRLLMVTDAPWDRRLGGPRVQIELGEEFERMGHRVDHFAYDDAFPKPSRTPRAAGFLRNFPAAAKRWIQHHGHRYDVIDARSGSLAASKLELGFDGLLVTRSNGLLPIYEREFLAPFRHRYPEARGRLLTRLPRRLQRQQVQSRVRAGFEHCDLLNVLNTDEHDFAVHELGMGAKTVKLLHGLTPDRLEAFRDSRSSVGDRLADPVIAFVGAWNRRKGCMDAASYVATIRANVPRARFRFLGTGVPAEEVVSDCDCTSGIDVVPRFESGQLPDLLGDAAVGILPSYVEGFPFGILEMLAAGLPVVAYDAPGARETLPLIDPTLLVSRGNPEALGERVTAVMKMEPKDYEHLVGEADDLASSLRWDEIATETIEVYEERLDGLRHG